MRRIFFVSGNKNIAIHQCELRYFLEAPPRFELGVKALQASALPLGYGAMNAA